MLYNQREFASLTKLFEKTSSDIHDSRFNQNMKFLTIYQQNTNDELMPQSFKLLAQKRIKDIELYMVNTIQSILEDPVYQEEALLAFFESRLVSLYKGKYRIYPSTTISYLPLKLRLSVYYWLYQQETDLETRCHLRNRLAVTLSRLQKKEVAEQIAIYNWVMAQGVSDYFSKDDMLKTTTKSIIRHSDRYKTRDFEAETGLKAPFGELYVCFTKLLDEKTYKYDKHHSMCADLIALFFKDYPEVKVMSDLVKSYLRTKDKKVLNDKLTKARLELIKRVIHLPNQKTGYTFPEDIKLQLCLYDKLIALTA